MGTHQHATLEDTVYVWFGSNKTDGDGDDGASPVFDVRLAGAAAGAAPVLSGSATLLSHGDYSAGAHEAAIAATDDNGFVAGNTYAVFVTLLVDSVNPTGFVGSFTLGPIIANATEISGDSTAADNLESQYDTTGLSGDTFPATQAAVGNLSTGSAAISTTATGTAASVPTVVGTPTNTYTATIEEDGTYHSWADVGDDIEFAYDFNIGPNASPVEFSWKGYATGNNKEIGVFARKLGSDCGMAASRNYNGNIGKHSSIEYMEPDNGPCRYRCKLW